MNRAQLMEECKLISVATLVSYMEKQKSILRKLKRNYWNKVKQEESRRINNQFLLDPGRVYSSFKKTIENQRDRDRPNMTLDCKIRKVQKSLFKDLNEATSFSKTLWEGEGTGNNETEWLEEIREAIREEVPEPSDDCFVQSHDTAAKVINKKRNWSVPPKPHCKLLVEEDKLSP